MRTLRVVREGEPSGYPKASLLLRAGARIVDVAIAKKSIDFEINDQLDYSEEVASFALGPPLGSTLRHGVDELRRQAKARFFPVAAQIAEKKYPGVRTRRPGLPSAYFENEK